VAGTEIRTRARGRSTAIRAAGSSVVVAALLVGLSFGAAAWAAEAGLLSHAHTSRLNDVRNTLRAAHALVTAREQAASRRATLLAAEREVQSAFVQRDAAALRAVARSYRDVGFILWDGRTVGRAAIGLPHAAITVYSRGRLAGQVVVEAPPDVPLLEARVTGDWRLLSG
jgi:hypothetical protein